MTEPTFVDTNVWVCAVDAADPAKRARALEFIAPAPDRQLVVSTQALTGQALTGFYSVSASKLTVPVPLADAEAMVRQLAVLPVVPIDGTLVVSAITGSREWQVSLRDTLILRAAEIAGCRRVLSEDLADGATYGCVVVENPFLSAR